MYINMNVGLILFVYVYFFIYILLIYLLINKKYKYAHTQELPPEAELTAEKVVAEPADHTEPKYRSAIPTEPQDRLAEQPND